MKISELIDMDQEERQRFLGTGETLIDDIAYYPEGEVSELYVITGALRLKEGHIPSCVEVGDIVIDTSDMPKNQ